MRVLLTALGFLVALTLSAPLRAQSAPAPFGLQWGMEVSGLTERYMPLQSTTRTGDLTVVNLTKAPRAPAETYLVNLLFDREMGLVKVRWMSTDIKGDATGKNGRRKYREVRQYVVDSYGEPTDEALVIGARLFDQDDEFYQCLAYEGRRVERHLGAGAVRRHPAQHRGPGPRLRVRPARLRIRGLEGLGQRVSLTASLPDGESP
jgi:hypothetical protein